MTFYLKPPQGVLHLSTLQTCVRERFHYLQALLSEKESANIPKKFDYLIEGTAMDRAGHYLLRLISLSSPNFQDFVAAAETKFFLLRLNSYNSSQGIRALLKLLHRHAAECSLQPNLTKTYYQFLLCVKQVSEEMMVKSVAAHCFNSNHHSSCTEFSLKVHFTMCLPMVREREVELHGGNAIIPCGKWKQLLALFFDEHIQLGIKHMHYTDCFKTATQDPRIKELMNEFSGKFKYNRHFRVDTYLKANEVERESVFFPPCMKHLYKILKKKHRLSHESRRHFTLFLKDAGMPLEEAIHFWSEEYSHPHSCSGCNHSWQQDSKRYIYSIRHMYGLEGGRYNYNVPSCSKIQAMSLNSMAEGGCPFVHFDDTRLKNCLNDCVGSRNLLVYNKILELRRDGHPRKACALHLSADSKQISPDTELSDVECNSFKVSNPIHYYFGVKLDPGNSS